MARNPFNWQQIRPTDNGLASQAAIRTAQQSVNNIVDIADGYQASRGKIDAHNFKQQGKLNTEEINLDANSVKSAEQFSTIQGDDGALSDESLFLKYGINFDKKKAQDTRNSRMTELIRKEVEDVAKISNDVEQMHSQGVGGINNNKARLLALATNDVQRAGIKTIVDAQTEVVLKKQNGLLIDNAIKQFGGLREVGDQTHNKAVSFLKMQAVKRDYTPEQTRQMIEQYELAEQHSTELSTTQNAQKQTMLDSHNNEVAPVVAHITRQMTNIQDDYTKAKSAYNSVDLTEAGTTNEAIVQSLAKGDAKTADYKELHAYISSQTGMLEYADGRKASTPGRVQAIFADLVQRGIDPSDDDNWEDMVQTAINSNNENYLNYQADYGDIVGNYTRLNDTLASITAESKAFGIKAHSAAKADGKAPDTPILKEYAQTLANRQQSNNQYLQDKINPNTKKQYEDEREYSVPNTQTGKERKQLEDKFSPKQLRNMKNQIRNLRNDEMFGPLLETESSEENPFAGNHQFNVQDDALNRVGLEGNFTLPTEAITAADYVAQGQDYISKFKGVELPNNMKVSTAAGPFQVTITNYATAIKRGILEPDAPMNVKNQTKVAAWLIAENSTLRKYLSTDLSDSSSLSVTKQKEIEESGISEIGKLWEGLKKDKAKAIEVLQVMRKRTHKYLNRAKVNGNFSESKLMDLLMAKQDISKINNRNRQKLRSL